MLQRIRDKSQGWIAWFIIGILCLAFVVWGFSSYFHLGGSNTIATVNGKEMTETRLHQVYQRLRREEQMQLGADYASKALPDQVLWQRAFDTVLSERVLSDELHNRGLYISDKQINAVIEQIPAFQEKGQFLQSRYLDVLSIQGLSPHMFTESIRMQFINNQLRAVFQDGSFVLPSELTHFIALGLQTRDIRYGEIAAQPFKSQIHISGNAIQQYYEENKALFIMPEKIRLSYITLSLEVLAKKIQVSDEQIRQFYQNHLDQYTLPARWKVQHIVFALPEESESDQAKADKAVLAKATDVYQQLQQGADFAKLAKQYSDDPLTAKKGGDLSWVTQGTLGAAFDKAILSLKPGQITQPFKTKYGYEIVKLNQVNAKRVKPLSEFRQQIKAHIAEQKAQEAFANSSDELANISYENPASLTKASKTLQLPIQTTDWIIKNQKMKTGIGSDQRVLAIAFSDDVLAGGNNSDLINLNPKTVIVLRVKDHVPATIKSLADVKSQIISDLLQKEMLKKAKLAGEKALRAFDRGVSAEKVAKQYHVSWTRVPDLSRNATNVDPTIVDYAFTLPVPTGAKPTYGGVSLDNGNYALVELLTVKPGQLSGKKAAVQERLFHQQLLNMIANYDYEQFVRGLLQEADVKIKDKRFKNNLVTTQ